MIKINTLILAEVCEVTPAAIRKWTLQGLPKAGRGVFDLAKAIAWVRRHRPLKGAEPGLIEERRREMAARARLRELDLLQRQGELIRREEVAGEFCARARYIKADLLFLDRTLNPRLEGLDLYQRGAILKKFGRDLLLRYCQRKEVPK